MQTPSISILSTSIDTDNQKPQDYFIFVKDDINIEKGGYNQITSTSDINDIPVSNVLDKFTEDIIYEKQLDLIEIEDGKTVEICEIDSLLEKENKFKLVKLNGEELTVSFENSDCQSIDEGSVSSDVTPCDGDSRPLETTDTIISSQSSVVNNFKFQNKYSFESLNLLKDKEEYINSGVLDDKFSFIQSDKFIANSVSSEQLLIEPLKNTFILSWDYEDHNQDNDIKVKTQGTQTCDINYEGSPLNMFYCSFYSNNNAETYCKLQTTENKIAAPLCSKTLNKTDVDHCTLSMEYKNLEMHSSTSDSKQEEINNETKKKPGRRRKMLQKSFTAVKTDTNKSLDYFSSSASDTIRKPNSRYSLRRKRKLKKYVDMEYIDQKLYDPKLELSCSECSLSFPTFYQLQQHAKTSHASSTLKFKCNSCPLSFTRPHNLERHKITRHGGEKKFKCEYCGKSFCRKDVITNHINTVHLKETMQKRLALDVLGIPSRKCEHCDKFFARQQNFLDHINGDLKCSICSDMFKCRTILRQHTQKQHQISCDKCHKVCKNKEQLYIHKLSHNPRFKCKLCFKTFIWQSQFQCHMAQHSGDRPFSCDVCHKSFPHKNAVAKHKWQEHIEKNKKFKCTVCNKAFVYQAKFDSHMRTHTGHKPFSCHLCRLSFSHNTNLKSHIRSFHGISVQEIKEDGSSHTRIIKYKRPKKYNNNNIVSNDAVDPELPKSILISAVTTTDDLVQLTDNKAFDIAPVTSNSSTIQNAIIEPDSVFEIVYDYS